MNQNRNGSSPPLLAGAAEVVITPPGPVFLWGYPRVQRISSGVHDDLYSSALYLKCDGSEALFLANDVIFIPKSLAVEVRRRIGDRTDLPPECILVSATHTHSGPMTVRYLSNEGDPVVPDVDPVYTELLTDRIVEAGCRAVANARPSTISFAVADATGIGTNRHDPEGPRDPRVPCWLVRDSSSRSNLALMAICAMHPTVLHEDSTSISGDFPGLARRHLKESGLLPPQAPFVYHTGASGNQSPRHVTKANTIEEAARLGLLLANAITKALASPRWEDSLAIECALTETGLTLRHFPDPACAKARLEATEQAIQKLQAMNAPRAAVRTAECDLFGAEEAVTLAAAALDGRVEAYAARCLPAEVQAIRLGDRLIVAWPGEHFVEFALELKQLVPNSEVITLANGELQGYIVTEEAARRNVYEAENALFAHDSAARILEASLQLARRLGKGASIR